MTLDPELANRVAYYQMADAAAVLGPKGWYCFGAYGSSGSSLFLAPRPITSADVLSDKWAAGAGDAIQTSWISGDTSGRFQVAKVIARAFPGRAAFAQSVIAEGVEPAADFPSGPFPGDQMTTRSDTVVEFFTPPNASGFGTSQTQLTPSADPVRGVAILQGQTPDVALLAVKLPQGDAALAAAIVARFEADSATAGAGQAQVAPAPTTIPAPPPAPATASETMAPEARAAGGGKGPDIAVVQEFYAALGNADGAAASGLVIPEKRAGPFSAAALTRFYGSMREPVRLVAAAQSAPGIVTVRYHYAYAGGRACDGGAEIAVTDRGGQRLIAAVRALNGC